MLKEQETKILNSYEELSNVPCTSERHMESGNTPPLVLNLVLGESGQLHAPAVLPPGKEQHLVISVISNFMENPFGVFSRFCGRTGGRDRAMLRGVMQKRECT